MSLDTLSDESPDDYLPAIPFPSSLEWLEEQRNVTSWNALFDDQIGNVPPPELAFLTDNGPGANPRYGPGRGEWGQLNYIIQPGYLADGGFASQAEADAASLSIEQSSYASYQDGLTEGQYASSQNWTWDVPLAAISPWDFFGALVQEITQRAITDKLFPQPLKRLKIRIYTEELDPEENGNEATMNQFMLMAAHVRGIRQSLGRIPWEKALSDLKGNQVYMAKTMKPWVEDGMHLESVKLVYAHEFLTRMRAIIPRSGAILPRYGEWRWEESDDRLAWFLRPVPDFYVREIPQIPSAATYKFFAWTPFSNVTTRAYMVRCMKAAIRDFNLILWHWWASTCHAARWANYVNRNEEGALVWPTVGYYQIRERDQQVAWESLDLGPEAEALYEPTPTYPSGRYKRKYLTRPPIRK